MKPLLTTDEAATRLGVASVTMKRMYLAGIIPVVRIGSQIVRVDEDDLERFIAKSKTGVAA